MTTIRNILLGFIITVPLLGMASPVAQARTYCDGSYCGDYYVYDPDYRHGTYNMNYWSYSLPYSYYYPYAYNYNYGYYPYYYPYYPSYNYQYYPQQQTYPMNQQGMPQYPSDPTYLNLSDYYKKLSDYYKAQSDYYKKLDDINKTK